MATNDGDIDRKMGLFIDLENLVLGVRETGDHKFRIKLVLQRLLEKGHILAKRAYAAWRRFEEYKRPFHEAAIEMVEIPGRSIGGKNSADIKMVVDVMDLAAQKGHVDTFVIASGDSDFSPLVSKLRENDKYVIGVGVKQSTSELLRDNCDEFIYYGDLVRSAEAPQLPKIEGAAERTVEGFRLLVDAIHALARNNKDVVWGSMVKQTICRKNPSFEESYYGYKSFSHMLEDAQRHKILTLRKDDRSGYQITGVAEIGAASQATG
jgi:uncharacterized LabA/DUF88 family protein